MISEQLEALKHRAKERLPIPAATVEKLIELIEVTAQDAREKQNAQSQQIANLQSRACFEYDKGFSKGIDSGFGDGYDKALEDAAKYCESYTINLNALYEMIENSGGHAIRTGEKYAHGIRAMKGKSDG